MIVFLTEEAEADLEAIGDHIAVDNPLRAYTFVRELRQSCERLSDMPEAFPVVERFATSGIRRRVHGNYLVFYRITDRVDVIHILHGAMDYERLLFPEIGD